ncbi:MAG: polyprenyl synthetase family protein [Lentisphaeria bacterium]|nr:polyprenyl synthetase family protein [Lentisphaeria bacterium]
MNDPELFMSELKKVAQRVNEILESDDFPDSIQPDFLREAVIDYPTRGGKRLRPALACWACGVLGGQPQAAEYPATATEVFHAWSLVHDDIIDNDEIRRGSPSEHYKLADILKNIHNCPHDKALEYGESFAMLCGDLQQSWCNTLLMKAVEHGVSLDVTLALLKRMHYDLSCGLISGEALDVEFSLRERRQLTEAEVINMICGKTGELLKFAAEIGGAIALDTTDFEHPQIQALGRFGLYTGIAFQLQDDYLGLFGVFGDLGKKLGGDLKEGKPTIMLLKAFERLDVLERAELASLLGLPQYSDIEIEQALQLIRKAEADVYILDEMENYKKKAEGELEKLPDNFYKGLLRDFLDFAISRKN